MRRAPMSLARAPKTRRRPATRAALRALATVVAVLLGLSSLGQTAHFLLVPHAICAEHGELLELSEEESHASSHEASHRDEEPHEDASQPTGEHEHCQVLARGQREQALPTPSSLEVPAPAAPAGRLRIAAPLPAHAALPTLSLAPKTSPPRAIAG